MVWLLEAVGRMSIEAMIEYPTSLGSKKGPVWTDPSMNALLPRDISSLIYLDAQCLLQNVRVDLSTASA